MRTIKGILFTDEFEFRPGSVTIEGEKIAKVEYLAADELSNEEQHRFVIPGLVDIHTHGCKGYDASDADPEQIKAIAAYEVAHGVTTFCPATMALPEAQIHKICRCIARLVNEEGSDAARAIKGIYLEGPFSSPLKCGAQDPSNFLKPDIDTLRAFQESAEGLIRIVVIAPEVEGAMECIRKGAGSFKFSIGHSGADYDTAVAAIEAGVHHVTHLHNAMSPYNHRAPGIWGAVTDSEGVDAEMIVDGIHIHPSYVRNSARFLGAEHLILISDSMAATGMPDGIYSLGGQKVIVRDHRATLESGALAGSANNLYDNFLYAMSIGIAPEVAVKAATFNPARAAGLDGRVGSLTAGKDADILITDEKFGIVEVVRHE